MPEIKSKPQRGIVASACQLNGMTFSMPAPARHHDILETMSTLGILNGYEIQGFLDHRGIFLNRKAAMISAQRWGQVTDESEIDGELYSEHLW